MSSSDETAGARVGDVIAGRYEIARVLGAGGMGAVYLARQVSMDRMVALKLIHPHIARNDEVAARFHREMKAASRVEHANTIQVFDYGATEDGRLFLAMEYLEGRSLAKLLADEGPLPFSRIVHIARQVVRALGAAHAEGIAHRDLKPDNVMLVDRYGDRDVVKVLDFGIARFIETTETSAPMTMEGALVGTPAYMSPEQALGRPIDYRSDLYSLGVLLFELAAGRLPFVAPTLASFLVAHATETPPAPSTIAGRVVPPRLEALILKLLSKSPDDRPTTASEVIRLLEFAEEELRDRATIAEPAPSAAVAPKEKRASLAPWIVTAGAIALTGVVGALFISRDRAGAAAARAGLDAILSADGEILAPPTCRTKDRALLARLTRAAALLKGSRPGVPRPEDREALVLLTTTPSESAEYWLLVGRARLVVDARADDAVLAARHAVDICPDFARAHQLLGDGARRAGHADQAEIAYDRALALAPGYLPPRQSLGLLALRRGDATRAVLAFDEVLRRDPHYPGARLARAQARLALQMPTEALADLEEATADDPRGPLAWIALGKLESTLGQKEKAAEAFCRARRLGSEDPEAVCP